MNCDDFKKRVHDLFRDRLSPDEAAEVQSHAETCDSCGQFMEICHELTCRDFVEFLHDYIDEELAPERVEIFDRHLSICPDCTAYIQVYRQTMNLSLSAAGHDQLPPAVPDELVNAILAARSS